MKNLYTIAFAWLLSLAPVNAQDDCSLDFFWNAIDGNPTEMIEMPQGVDVEVTINGIPVEDLESAENVMLLGFLDSFEICATLISENCPDGITECEIYDMSDFIVDEGDWTDEDWGDWNDSTWVDNGDWDEGDWGDWDWNDEDWSDNDDWDEGDWDWNDSTGVDNGDWDEGDWGDWDWSDNDDWDEGEWDWNDSTWVDNGDWDDEDWGDWNDDDNWDDGTEDGNGGLVAGIEDEAPIVEWSVFPVPAINNITFKGLPEGTFAAAVYDSQGRFVMNQNVQNGQTIFVSDLPNGYYSIHIPAIAGSMNRFVVQH
jgi:hypothetical protein